MTKDRTTQGTNPQEQRNVKTNPNKPASDPKLRPEEKEDRTHRRETHPQGR